MVDLIKGFAKFHNEIYRHKQELFTKLARNQEPQALFITCQIHELIRTCSRIPNQEICLYCEMLKTSFQPMVRSSVEPRLKEIIVCGHTDCGAMKALLHPELMNDLPAVREWLRMAESTRQIMKEVYPDLKGEELFGATIKENVLVQLEHLRTHPAVATRLRSGALTLHGWIYSIATGEVWLYDSNQRKFVFPKELE
jgi:carbonic anhydrase